MVSLSDTFNAPPTPHSPGASNTSEEILQDVKNENDLQRAARQKQQKNAVTASDARSPHSLLISHAVVQPAAVVIHAEHARVAARAVFAPANPLDFARGAESFGRDALPRHDFHVRLLQIDVAERRGLQLPAGIDGATGVGVREIDPENEIGDGEENVESGASGKRGDCEHSENGENEETEDQNAGKQKEGEVVVDKVSQFVENAMVLKFAQQPKRLSVFRL